MLATISKYVTALILALIVFVNSIGNFIGIGDIIETQPPETSQDWNETYLGYRYDSKGDFYYIDDKDCWQRNTGYNEVYDNMASATGMFIDQVRIRFNYEDKDWMIQMWKGQYGFLLVGSEVAIFTAPENENADASNVSRYGCADKNDWLDIQHEAYWSEGNTGEYEKIFEREYGKYWWATGYAKGQLTKYAGPKTELKTSTRITFKSEEMANLFAKGLNTAGFAKADAYDKLTDDSYYLNGADVYVNWLEIDCDINAGNGENEPVVVTKATPTEVQR